MSCPSARGLPNVPYKTPILSFPFLFPEACNRKTRPSHIVFDHHCRTVCRVQGCCLFHPRHLASPRVHDRHLHLHLLASTSAKRLMRVFPPAARLLRSFRFRVSLFQRKLRLRLMPIQPVGMFSTRYFTCAGTMHMQPWFQLKADLNGSYIRRVKCANRSWGPSNRSRRMPKCRKGFGLGFTRIRRNRLNRLNIGEHVSRKTGKGSRG
jgi:hypothetical protein